MSYKRTTAGAGPDGGSPGQDPGLLYEAGDSPPSGLSLGLGAQFAMLSLGSIVLAPTIAYSAAGTSAPVLAWAVFASLLIAGAATAVQAFPLGRVGAGYILVTGATAPAIVISVDALTAGGPALLVTLMLASALLQFAFAYRLSMLRRIITPTVSGVILMLIAVTVMPIGFQRITQVPAGHPWWSGFQCALATVALIVIGSAKGPPRLRPWAPLIGILGGAAVAGAYGLYDVDLVLRAAWIGLPQGAEWPRPGLDFGPAFWRLLPAFLLLSTSGAIRTMSATLAVQDVSWKTPRAPDLRAVQGGVAAEALANLLAGLGGTILNATRSATVPLIRITRVGARRVGIVTGVALIVLAFLPKVLALVLALPPAVLAAYLIVMMANLFVAGMKIAVDDGLGPRRIMITGISFWIGAGCHYGLLLPDVLPEFAGGLLSNGLAAGGLAAIGMTVLLQMTEGRRWRFDTSLDVSRYPELREFIVRFASKSGLSRRMLDRLNAAAEETLLTLVRDRPETDVRARRLRVTAHRESGAVVLEFVAKSVDSNLEDQIALLGDANRTRPAERDLSLRLLRHLASDVRHQQYHDVDFVTVRVEASGSAEPME